MAQNDVLIRVGAAGVNNTDINTRTGWYSKAVTGDTAASAAGATADDGGWAACHSHFRASRGPTSAAGWSRRAPPSITG